MSLNEDLAKAIAKGHDIGHTAFGHAGEEELEQICQEEFCYCKVNDLKTKDATMYVELERKYGPLNDENLRKKVPVLERVLKEEFMNQLKREFFVQVKDTRIFLHAKQSFRLLCVLEGKKLTAQTVHGIISHNYPWDEYGNWEIDQTEKIKRIEDPNPLKQRNPLAFVIEQYKVNKEHQTYEGQVVKFADFLAFAIHDLDDALRAEKLKLSDLEARFKQKFPGLDFDEYLVGPNRYARYISQFFEANRSLVKQGTPNLIKPEEAKEILGWLSTDIVKGVIHKDKEIERKHSEGKRYIRGLFSIWKKQKDELRNKLNEFNLVPELNTSFENGYSSIRQFCDFISVLTDNEIIKLYRHFYGGPEQ